MVLYSAIGAIIARAGEFPDLKHALFSGIAAPAIVVSVLAGAADGKTKTEAANKTNEIKNTNETKKTDEIFFISSAHAEPEGIRNPRPIQVETRVQGGDPVTAQLGVYAVMAGSDAKDKLIFVGNINLDGTRTNSTDVSIPADAKGLKFTNADGSVSSLASFDSSSAPDMVTVTITPRTSISRDFIWALGGKRNFAIGELSAASGRK
jgi:hypothetical protein